MAGLLLDITPLREYPTFRRLWTANAISSTGTQLSVVAVAYEVYHLTGSNLDVGLISLFQLVPAFFGALAGGSIADAMDRRKLLILTGTAAAVIAVLMALDVSRSHPSLAILYALSACGALAQGLNNPGQNALLLSLVDRPMMVKANALRQVVTQLATVIGPSCAGMLIAGFGTKVVFWVNAASFLVPVAALFTIEARPPVGGTTRFGLQSIAEGFRFLKGRQALQGCFIADINAMVLGMPTALFPALAVTHFHGGARTVGLLYAAPGIGAVLGAGLSGWTGRIRRPGFAVCVAIAFWGLAIAAFGLVSSLVIAVFCLVIAGWSDVISAVFRGAIVQIEAPDRLRGRLSSIQSAVVSGGPRLGNTEAGLVAAATSTQFSVVSGGIGCMVGIALVAKVLPRFVHYTLPHHVRSSVTDESERESTSDGG